MTETPVSRLILNLGIPTTISMLITSIYNMADTYFVGTLGESAQAATGILFTVQAIMQGLAFMLATARAPMFPGRWQTGTLTKPPCTFPLPSSPAWGWGW